ncbi:MAG: alpha/beta hydrolase [Hamadaea sp.]|nr:alpha/beta hydrolase [Hamadaea sp.]
MTTATAPDGVTLGYRELGDGPGLVVVHGSMQSSHSHLDLARALAADVTVYLPDRRGRGLSGPFAPGYTTQSEVDDLAALLTATGARAVFGVSSGAIVLLATALARPDLVHQAVIFEPPLFADPAEPAAILAGFDRELAAGDLPAAMVTGMLGAQMGPPILQRVPRGLLKRLTSLGMKADDKKTADGHIPMRQLGPLLHHDFTLAVENSGPFERYAGIQAEVLLLNGSKSPAYLRESVASLARVLPAAQRVELPGLDHGASGNAAERGKPEVVADAIRTFLR